MGYMAVIAIFSWVTDRTLTTTPNKARLGDDVTLVRGASAPEFETEAIALFFWPFFALFNNVNQ